MGNDRCMDRGRLLEEKGKAAEDFLSASLRLAESLRADRWDDMARQVRRRQELIAKMESQDRQLGREGFPVDRFGVAPDLRETYERIQSANRECIRLAQRQCDALRRQIQSLHREGNRLRGYGSKSPPDRRFLDLCT